MVLRLFRITGARRRTSLRQGTEEIIKHQIEETKKQHERLFSILVDHQTIPKPQECSSDPYPGFEDAGETIQLEPKLLLDETAGWYRDIPYPLEHNSNAKLTVGEIISLPFGSDDERRDVEWCSMFCYVAHLRVSPRAFRATTRKRYCALVYLFYVQDPELDQTNDHVVQEILGKDPTPPGVTRLYPSNQHLWIDAAALLTYGRRIFVDGISPPQDNVGQAKYLATHLCLYPVAHGGWCPQNDDYDIAARFCPLKRRDGSRNFPFRLEGFHDRDDVTPSPLLIEETWAQIAALYDFTEIGREKAFIQSETREALIRDRERKKRSVTECIQLYEVADDHVQTSPEPATSDAMQGPNKRSVKNRMNKRKREGLRSSESTDFENAFASWKKAKTTTMAVNATDAAASSGPRESTKTATTQPSAIADTSPQDAQDSDDRMSQGIINEEQHPLDGGQLSYAAPDPPASRSEEAPPQAKRPHKPNLGSAMAKSPSRPVPTLQRPPKLPVPSSANLRASLESVDKEGKIKEVPKSLEDPYIIRLKSENVFRIRLELHYKKRHAEAEAAFKQREEEMAKAAKEREDVLLAEIQKLKDEARISAERSEEMVQEHKRREEALAIEAQTAIERREEVIRVEIAEEHKQQVEALVAEAQTAIERREVDIRVEMAGEHKQRENALRMELESRSARVMEEMEMANAKLRAEFQHDTERLGAELAVEREKLVGMKHRIEILQEENGILVAEKELGERKARLAALREKAGK